MKAKSLFALCMVLVMAFLCCACTTTPNSDTTPPTTEVQELTAAEIVGKMQEALTATPCSKLELVMNIAMSMDAGESGKMDMTTKSTTQMTISQDPVSSYSVATAEVGVAGETTTATTENYSVLEDGELVSYVSSNGIWMKVPTGQTPEDLTNTASSVAVDLSNVTVDQAVTEWNGKKVICLKTQLTGDVVQNALGNILGSMGEAGGALGESANILESVDYTKLTCNAIIYLDAETYLPVAEEMTFDGMNEVMAPMYEGMGISVDVTSCVSTGIFLSYEAQPAVTLPEGVAEKAEVWTRLLSGESDNGDGTFTIREGTALMDIVHPEGFEVSDKDYDHVTFQRDDYRQITYMMSYITNEQTPGTGEYFLATNDSSEARWSVGGGKVNREQMALSTDTLTFTCDLLATTWETGREDASFYAWTALSNDGSGTYYLYIEVKDGYNDGMGFSKSADITTDEFMTYLNAAAPSKLTAE